jgi:phosphonoacetaldehyde hydrolase
MPSIVHQNPYAGPVRAVVLDWAGTAVDHGCLGPAAVFVEAFKSFDVRATFEQARQFMGLEKQEHVRRMLQLGEIAEQWRAQTGRQPAESDVEAVYARTTPMMVEALKKHCELIPGTLEFVDGLRRRDIKIGSCTGYTRPMMDVLAPLAAAAGYSPDAVVCSSDAPAGRPFPWMCYLNAIQLEVYPMAAMVKIGDTLSDIEEGLNAGMWTIGLSRSGNELGLSEQQAAGLPQAELEQRLAAIRERYENAGAHYVADGIWACLPLIDAIGGRLAQGERPA